MSQYFITAKALRLLGRIVTSCLPTKAKLVEANYGYLVETARKENDVIFGKFVNDLPLPDCKYQQMLALAAGLGKTSIDEEVVAEFFGGEPHLEKVSIEAMRLKKALNFTDNRLRKMFFAHILIPVLVVKSIPSAIAAVYKNGDLEVQIKGLVSVIFGENIMAGTSYWVHYSSIVATARELGEEIENRLLAVQGQDPKFVESCKSVGTIDYSNFRRFSGWTQELIDKRGFRV